MAQVRSVAESAKKFVTRAQGAAEDYKAGVSNAGARWAAGAEASNDAYKAGIAESLNEDRFVRGVRKAGAGKYQNNAVKLGPERFRTGVQNAEQAYVAGTQPYVSAMQGFTYSTRRARGQNAHRVQEQIDLMRKTRREVLGG